MRNNSGVFASSSPKDKASTEKRWGWLANRRDGSNRPPDHPLYDPNTIYIPPNEFFSLTPTRKQYWAFKRNHMNTVVFFQVGSFFELYEDDAEIAQRLFGMKVQNKVNMMNAGFPTHQFDEFAAKFVARGYQVAKIEQRCETADDRLKAMNNATFRSAQAEHRKVTDVLTTGTMIDPSLLGDSARVLLSLVEVEAGLQGAQIGFCLLDAAVGKFSLGVLADDPQRTQLETLLLQVRPEEYLLQKGCLSQPSRQLLMRFAGHSGATDRYLQRVHTVEPHAAEDVCRMIEEAKYFGMPTAAATSPSVIGWPKPLEAARQEKPLAMSALGAILTYLRSFDIEFDGHQHKDVALMRLNNFEQYHLGSTQSHSVYMILDAQTLTNLEILENNTDHTARNSLLAHLNHCHTPFGKRLIRQWLCLPLRSIRLLDQRLDIVTELLHHPEIHETIASQLKPLPDLERAVARLHSHSMPLKSFLTFVSGVLTVWQMIEDYQSNGMLAELSSDLPFLLSPSPAHAKLEFGLSVFPDLTPLVRVMEAIDLPASQAEDCLVLKRGFDAEYDVLLQQLDEIKASLNDHLSQIRRRLGAKPADITYRDSKLGRSLIEIKSKVNTSSLLGTMKLIESNKSSQRFRDEFVEALLPELEEAEERIEICQKSAFRKYMLKIDEYYDLLREAIQCIAQVDCLLALATTSLNLGEVACRPSFVTDPRGTMIELESYRHPTLVPTSGNDIIPNSLNLGGAKPSTLLLTGPNMGGKSTLLRATCMAFILAQIGCFVPAQACNLTPVDRIFTRVGSSDNMLTGRSTFMVELAETATILRHATPQSLVVFDELGRGTSTCDFFFFFFLFFLINVN